MIETEDEWCMVNVIVQTGPENLEKIVASLRISKKINFKSMTPHQAFASMSRQGQNKKKGSILFQHSLCLIYASP